VVEDKKQAGHWIKQSLDQMMLYDVYAGGGSLPSVSEGGLRCWFLQNFDDEKLFRGTKMVNRVVTRYSGLYWCVILGLLMMANANAGFGQDYFDAGIQASSKEDYSVALRYFKKARQAGMDTAVLQYNMAVSYYRLRQYENARRIFLALTDVRAFEQRAYFNLGLIANKQKDEPAAVRWFQRAHRNVDSKQIQALANEALNRLGSSPRKVRRVDPGWTGFISGSLAYDSNVTLVNNDLLGVTNQDDTVMNVSASAARWLKGGINNGVRMSLGASLQKHSKLSRNDYDQLNARVMRYDRLGDWKIRVGGSWNEIYFDGSEYQRIVGADVRSRRELSENNQLHLRYKLSRIQATDAAFDYLDGWRHQLRAGIQLREGKDRVRYYYQLELNDRKDFIRRVSGTNDINSLVSYSPARHTVRVTGWWELNSNWHARLDTRYRYARYNDSNILSGRVTSRREDSQIRLSARISRKFSRRWTLDGQYTYTNNDSNIDRRSYDRSIVKVGVSRSF